MRKESSPREGGNAISDRQGRGTGRERLRALSRKMIAGEVISGRRGVSPPTGDRGLESTSLLQRVVCERGSAGDCCRHGRSAARPVKRFQVHLTSAAENGAPSCHLIPLAQFEGSSGSRLRFAARSMGHTHGYSPVRPGRAAGRRRDALGDARAALVPVTGMIGGLAGITLAKPATARAVDRRT
jgi:hypothetical protein